MLTNPGLCVSAEINNGPLSVLQTAVKNHSQILIALRNGRKLLARCKAFDRHCNLVLENVKEVRSFPLVGVCLGWPSTRGLTRVPHVTTDVDRTAKGKEPQTSK